MIHSKISNSHYELKETGEFVIKEYNTTKLFSSFFPGIAGKNGIPMWLFYVNRGQCICSMGIQNKQQPIMEFLSANWAYNLVSRQGFRTFIKPSDNPQINYYEPFQNLLWDSQIDRTQRMIIEPFQLTLEEENHTLGLKFIVQYFNVPQDNYAGLIRKLQIKNLNPDTIILEGLDGLPLIIPYGVDNNLLKNMRRLVEAFVEVINYDKRVPFFKGKVETADRPDVLRIKKGNFYVGFESNEGDTKILLPIVDPEKVFGTQSDFSYPEKFIKNSNQELLEGQIFENRLPCAMGLIKTAISSGETYTYTSIIGHAASQEELNALIPGITKNEYIENKAKVNKDIITVLTQNNLICSNEPVLDYYSRQNFLDNSLRGGFPHTLDGGNNKSILHLYSRKHGDLERDYNDFLLMPTHYSQGNGNFRDVNQNRRCDLFINPEVQENNVEHFYNLIQLDGFNPLVIKETRFAVKYPEKLSSILTKYLGGESLESSKDFLQNPFTPGEFLSHLKEHQIKIKSNSDTLIGNLIGICTKIYDTDYGEGYWTDHWTYNLDLLENFLAVYPERHRQILFEKKTFSFYDNAHRVQPRDEKYVIWEGNAMQLDAVVFDEEKDSMVKQREQKRNLVRVNFGKGEVYYTSLINKVLCLIINKLASLDPEGIGVEMEAGKPNWYDALNGLPGYMGSSISETLEIKRHILFLQETFRECKVQNESVAIFEELNELMKTLNDLLMQQMSPMEFWDKATSAKELYREKTRLGISGDEKMVTVAEIKEFLAAGLKKLDDGIQKAWNKNPDILSTYFMNKVTDYQLIEQSESSDKKRIKKNKKGLTCFRAKKFNHIPLPLFLEGPVHYLRCKPEKKDAEAFVRNIKQSELYDKKLKMYKVNAQLTDQPMEIGRARVFSPGWFENESVWLHMEYKYLLELLRNQLYDEFYKDFKNVCVPFFNPEVYGRSILENSSFIVSSANPDPSIHGNGFVARLSGATAEFIHILLLMTVGSKPFYIDEEGNLILRFTPALPGWLFTQQLRKIKLYQENQWRDVEIPAKTFSFMFLGEILVTFHNPDLKDTYGPNGVSPAHWTVVDLSDNTQTFSSDSLSGDIVKDIRNRKVKCIDIELN
jgi:hypothetical protein